MMIAKLTTKSCLTSLLPSVSVLALAGAFALGMAFTMVAPQPGFAAFCAQEGDQTIGPPGADEDPDDHGRGSNTACGNQAEAFDGGPGSENTALGAQAKAGDPQELDGFGQRNTAVGSDSQAGYNTLADRIGTSDNTAIGQSSRAGTSFQSHRNTALGVGAQAGASNNINGAVAVGTNAQANASGAIAIGGDDDNGTLGAIADGATAIAIGNEARADTAGALAIGGNQSSTGTTFEGARAEGIDSTAIGASTVASAASTTAVGTRAQATHTNSAAFGTGVMTQRDNQYIFGGAMNTYTTPGITSQASRDQQDGPLEIVTSDAAGNLATGGGEFIEQINRNEEGVAMAMALGGFWVPYQKRFAMSAGVGVFNDAVAASVQLGLQISDNVHVTGGLAIGGSDNFDSQQVGGRANILVSF